MDGRDRQQSRLTEQALDLLREEGGAAGVVVRGSSMLPTLAEGQEVAVDLAADPLRPGELLLFRQHDYLAIHRLVGTGRRLDGRPCLRTRGDGRSALDPPLNREDVRGRIVAVREAGGWRDLTARRARLYARAVAAHDLAWAAVAAVARRLDRAIAFTGLEPSLAVAMLDRALLRLAHRVLFARCHPRVAGPARTGC
jgi:hypothetical protein